MTCSASKHGKPKVQIDLLVDCFQRAGGDTVHGRPRNCCKADVPTLERRANNPAGYKGFVFSVPVVNNVPDLHGNPGNAKLVLFIAGNQYMVLPRQVEASEVQHPELKGRIYYETLPPGILLRQMENRNTLTLGNLTLTVAPDVFEAGAKRLAPLATQGKIHNVVLYASNNLAIMVRKAQAHPVAERSRQAGRPRFYAEF